MTKLFKYNLIKTWRFEHFVKSTFSAFFNYAIYNASLHRLYSTRKNKFLTKNFAIVILPYLTFATAKVKIKLASHFCPNSHGWKGFQNYAERASINIAAETQKIIFEWFKLYCIFSVSRPVLLLLLLSLLLLRQLAILFHIHH